jgi:hypothetical protein
MNAARYAHTATILGSGKVLVAGGFLCTKPGYYDAIASAELYDPASGTFTATGSLSAERVYHTAAMLPNGKVLLAGGVGLSGGELASAELYDPVTGRFTPGPTHLNRKQSRSDSGGADTMGNWIAYNCRGYLVGHDPKERS